MKLGSFLDLVNEYETVIVTQNAVEIARYDGKNSIPVELNGMEIVTNGISVEFGKIYVEVK